MEKMPTSRWTLRNLRHGGWCLVLMVGLWPWQSHAVGAAPVGSADAMTAEQAEQTMESVKQALCFLAKAGESAGGMSDALGGGGGGGGAAGAGQMLGSVAGMLSSMCQMTNLEAAMGGDLMDGGLGGLQDGLAGQLGEQLAGQVMQQAQQILQQKMQGGKKGQGGEGASGDSGYEMSQTYSEGNKPSYNGMDYYQVGDGSAGSGSSLSPTAKAEFQAAARSSWNSYAQQLADSGVQEAVVLLQDGGRANQSGGGLSIGNGATTGNAGVSIGGAAGAGGSVANQTMTLQRAQTLMTTRQQNFLRGFARARAGLAQESALANNADYRKGYAAGAATLQPTRT